MSTLKKTCNIFREEVNQIKFSEKCFIKALKNFEEHPMNSYIERAIFGLEISIYRLLDNASELFIQDSYPESFILLRASYESVLIAEFLQTREEDAEKWVTVTKYYQRNIREKIGASNEVYRVLSTVFAHPNVESIRVYLDNSRTKPACKLDILIKDFSKRAIHSIEHYYYFL